mmetsp:Transcript_1637/g.3558  ORF Transcript_1637/g.3558 Transcript_1637/m.3558 type:complete len:555 (+) Transcript_1637:75-1739(+)
MWQSICFLALAHGYGWVMHQIANGEHLGMFALLGQGQEHRIHAPAVEDVGVGAWPDLPLSPEAHQSASDSVRVTSWRLAAIILAGACLMVGSYLRVWATTPSRAACVKWQLQVLGYFELYLFGIGASALAPTALSISYQLGHGVNFSGLILSSLWMISAPGAVAGRFVATHTSQFTKRVLQASLIAVASVCYLITAIVTHDWPVLTDVPRKDTLFIAPRAICGFVLFMYVSVMFAMVTEVCQPALRVRQQLYQNLCLMAGSGTGPMIVAIVTSSTENTAAKSFGLAAPFYVSAALYLFHSIAAWLVTPGDADAMKAAAEDTCGLDLVGQTMGGALPATLPSDERSLYLRKLVFWFGNLYGVERAVVTIALEAATSFVLERYFGWPTSRVAFWVGIVYLLGTLVAYPMNMLKDRMGELYLMKCGSILGVVASILLAIFIRRAEYVVLIADFVLFSACFLASGVAEGMCLAAAIPESPWFNVETAWCFRNVVKQNLGRFVTPLLIRGSISHSTALYGVVQVSMTGVGFLLCRGLVDAAYELRELSDEKGRLSNRDP